MRAIETVEINTTTAFDQAWDLVEMGARAFIFQGITWTPQDMLITARPISAGDPITIRTVANIPSSTALEPAYFGVPLITRELRIQSPAAGTKQASITFLDEPIPPFGRAPLIAGTVTIPAGSSATQLNLTAMPFARQLLLFLQADHRGALLVTQALNTQQIVNVPALEIANANGGSVGPALIPILGQISLTLENRDAAAPNNMSYTAITIFDPPN